MVISYPVLKGAVVRDATGRVIPNVYSCCLQTGEVIISGYPVGVSFTAKISVAIWNICSVIEDIYIHLAKTDYLIMPPPGGLRHGFWPAPLAIQWPLETVVIAEWEGEW